MPLKTNDTPLEQEILNMIEFFPIKCRIQKAKRNFIKYQEDLTKNKDFWECVPGNSHQPSIKVITWWITGAGFVGLSV